MPTRTCIGCRKTDEQQTMVRMVADEAGRIRMGRALAGRGAYLHDDPGCVGEALKKGAIGRALKRRVVAVEEQELVRRVHEARGNVR